MVNVEQCSTARQNRLSTRTRTEVRPVPEPTPYWSGLTATLNQMLWLPTGTDQPNAAINHANGWPSKTAAQSWFAVSHMTAPNPFIPQIYSTTATRAAAVDSHANATVQQSRRIPRLSKQPTEENHQHLARRQPLELQPHRRDFTIRHTRKLAAHRRYDHAGDRTAVPRMGQGPLPGEAYRGARRLPGP